MAPGKLLQADKLSGKEVPNSPGHLHMLPPPKEVPKNWYLCILEHLKSGLHPAEIARQLGIPKQTLQLPLKQTKANRAITKIGYGVWEVSDSAISEDKKKYQVTPGR